MILPMILLIINEINIISDRGTFRN